MTPEQRLALWTAINHYAEVCGGTVTIDFDSDERLPLTRREKAVVEIEKIVDWIEGAQQAAPKSPLPLLTSTQDWNQLSVQDWKQKGVAPVQPTWTRGKLSREAGVISWKEHLEAWEVYNARYHGQTAERLVERGGFYYEELVDLLGHEPTTWKARWPRT